MPYIYRVSRRTFSNRPAEAGVVASTAVVPEAVAAEAVAPPVKTGDVTLKPAISYRDLQAQAKGLGISGKQTAKELKKAIREANQ